MKIRCEYTRLVPVDELKPNPINKKLKKHTPEAIERTAKVLEYQGWRRPITVSNQTGFISVGHKRLYAAKLRGWETVPVSFQDYDDETQETADLVSDNALNEWDTIDLAGVNEIVPDMGPDFDLDFLGIKGFTLDPKADFGDEDAVGETPIEPKVKRGELWILGEHCLLIDDCTVKENVERLIGGEKADMVFTDPPYGIGADGGFDGSPQGFGGSGKTIARRRYKGEWDNERPTRATLENLLGVADEAIIFGGNYLADLLPQGKHWLVWDKGNTMPSLSDCELAWTNIKRVSVKKYAHTFNGLIGKEKERFHPTQKPVALFETILNDYNPKTVADLFLGSGSTLIACEKTNRKCFGMEIDAHYGQVIIERWQKFTGKEAVREDGVKFSDLIE